MRYRFYSAVLAYARSMDVWWRSGKVSTIVPYGWLSGRAELAGQPQQREISGLGDARFRFSVNFFGAPAFSLKEFANYRQDTIVGASLELTVPSGQYDPNKLVNNATNRWSIKPELGISKAWVPLTAELSAAARIFSDNGDFLGNGSTREQYRDIRCRDTSSTHCVPVSGWRLTEPTTRVGKRQSTASATTICCGTPVWA